MSLLAALRERWLLILLPCRVVSGSYCWTTRPLSQARLALGAYCPQHFTGVLLPGLRTQLPGSWAPDSA